MTKTALPKPDEKKPLTVEVDVNLLGKVRQAIDNVKRTHPNFTMRYVIEYGMERWLEELQSGKKSK